MDDLVASVGYGKITPLQIVNRFIPKSEPEEDHESLLNKLIKKVQKKKKQKDGVIVTGMDDILVKFGKCCTPVPGDAIIGYITRGHGVTVHKTGCVNVTDINPERQIDVEWNSTAKDTYPVRIRVISYDRVRLLADMADNISKNGANILDVNSKTLENKMVDSLFTIAVENTEQLEKILSGIKKIKQVQGVERLSC